jgi:hypothetical protein
MNEVNDCPLCGIYVGNDADIIASAISDETILQHQRQIVDMYVRLSNLVNFGVQKIVKN